MDAEKPENMGDNYVKQDAQQVITGAVKQFQEKVRAEIRDLAASPDCAQPVSYGGEKYKIQDYREKACLLYTSGQAIGFNPVYLSRIFKQIEGTSIREYIETCRMDMARRLIQSTRMKVYEIAEKCGYQNPAYFIKIFRAHYGMTPQECRDMG